MAKKRKQEMHPHEMTHRQLSHHKKAERRQHIIFFGGVAIIVAVVLIIVGGWLAGEYLPMHQTVLQVYDTKFDASFVIDSLVIYGRSQQTASLTSMATSVLSQIMQNETIRLEAEKLGISVTDEEAEQYLQNANVPINDATRELARGALLSTKIKNEHFAPLAPTSDNQVLLKAMMVESVTMARLVREKIASGENFTKLVEQYATDAASKDVLGDYGWHPISVFRGKLYSTIPLDYISRADVKAGDLSQPLSDNVSYKKLGYWLIKINDRLSEDSANVSAILLGSEEEALAIRTRLQAGEELAPIADNLSQYAASKEKHGEMGLTLESDNISKAYNAYVFDTSIETGKWSQPIRDDNFYTKGGAWLVLVADKEENKELTTEDRDQLINQLYSNWVTEITTAASTYMVNNATDELLTWMVARATEKLRSG